MAAHPPRPRRGSSRARGRRDVAVVNADDAASRRPRDAGPAREVLRARPPQAPTRRVARRRPGLRCALPRHSIPRRRLPRSGDAQPGERPRRRHRVPRAARGAGGDRSALRISRACPHRHPGRRGRWETCGGWDDSKGTSGDAAAKSLEGHAPERPASSWRPGHGQTSRCCVLSVKTNTRAVLTRSERSHRDRRPMKGAAASSATGDDGKGLSSAPRGGPARRHGTAFAGLRLVRPVSQLRGADDTSPRSHARPPGQAMARKLASDKLLFVTLVALSLFGCV